jgi:hypothetical protein
MKNTIDITTKTILFTCSKTSFTLRVTRITNFKFIIKSISARNQTLLKEKFNFLDKNIYEIIFQIRDLIFFK